MDIVIDLVIDIVILLLSCYEILDLLSATVTEISNGKIWIESKMRAMRCTLWRSSERKQTAKGKKNQGLMCCEQTWNHPRQRPGRPINCGRTGLSGSHPQPDRPRWLPARPRSRNQKQGGQSRHGQCQLQAGNLSHFLHVQPESHRQRHHTALQEKITRVLDGAMRTASLTALKWAPTWYDWADTLDPYCGQPLDQDWMCKFMYQPRISRGGSF